MANGQYNLMMRKRKNCRCSTHPPLTLPPQSKEVAGRLKKSSVGMVAANSRKCMVVNMV